ncbi:hypothetical protein LCGC14_2044740 [marine sediment metagenome]|uniref:ABC transmembrane type-1 domain-containing protein n=1 Tax=marine sediment metagenome TaxID=412755 RepID=A0A0F9EQQ3_9ZZZZ
MQKYILRRILLNLLAIFFVVTLVFLLLRIDTDNVITRRVTQEPGTSPEAVAQVKESVRKDLGLDGSIFRQYRTYLWNLAHGDLGESFSAREDIVGEIKDRIGPSLELGLLQVIVAMTVALPIGVISAIRQDSMIDYLLRFLAIALLGVPVFVLAVFVILFSARSESTFLSEWLGVHAVWADFFDDPVENMKRMTGPAIIGGLGTGAIIMRFLRSQMLEVMRQDYVRTAWAKGLRERVIVTRHCLKNAMIPVLTVVGLLVGTIVSGNVILETLFNIPGIGLWVVSAIGEYDYPIVQGVVLVVAVILVFVNLLVDIAYGWLDPRIRYG